MSQFPDQGIHGPGSQYVRNPSKYYTAKQIQIAMRNTVVTIMEAHKRFGYTQKEAASSLNFACTDGETIVAIRCRTLPRSSNPILCLQLRRIFVQRMYKARIAYTTLFEKSTIELTPRTSRVKTKLHSHQDGEDRALHLSSVSH